MAKEKAPEEEDALSSHKEMSTLVDRMLAFIREHRKTSVAELADVFALDNVHVEKLATMLEDSGLVTMRYALLNPGKTEIIALAVGGGVMAPPEPQAPQKPAFLHPSKTAAGRAAQAREAAGVVDQSLRDMMSADDTDLAEIRGRLNDIERDVMSRLVHVERSLNEIEKRERTASKADVDYLIYEAAKLELIRQDMSSRVKVFDEKLNSVGSQLRRVKHKVRRGLLHSIIYAITSPLRLFKQGERRTK